MNRQPGSPAESSRRTILAVAALAAATFGCGGPPTTRSSARTALRVGISSGQLSATNPTSGIRQIVQNITTEGLARVASDGRMEPQLAKGWVVSEDGRSLRIDLKAGIRFFDGSSLDAHMFAAALPGALRALTGDAFLRGVRVEVIDAVTLSLGLDRPSRLLVESLEAPIRKPDAPTVSTGPFLPMPDSPNDLRANDAYYMGRPGVEAVAIKAFPSVRSAWAELLRNNIDMLYEVGPDALDSLESSTSVSVFTFIRPYQYQIAFNTAAPVLRSREVRRALNLAIDRERIVRLALNGHGVASSGPFRANHWAIPSTRGFEFDPERAARALIGKSLRFSCFLPSDPIYERIALEVKRELAEVGVVMDVKALSPDEILAAQLSRNYEAVLTETITGPTLLRLYLVWHSSGALNAFGRGTPAVDAALDEVRNAANDDQYRAGVGSVQRAFFDDPPAILLAWSERARAVSKRFVVPQPEPGRDVLATLRLWKPSNDDRFTSRN